jgi:hypothetical protein
MKSIILFLCTIASFGAHAATEIAGVKYPDTVQVSGQILVLNGAGLRKKLFFKVYAAGLYLPQRADTVPAVLAASGPRRMAIVTLRDLGARQFTDALQEGLEKNLSDAELAALQPAITRFSTALQTVGEAREGTPIQIDFTPEVGTMLTVSGQPVGDPIVGKAFYDALLRVWIGDHPAQDDLKKALLGETSR